MRKSIVISVIMFLIMGIFMGSVNAASATVSLRADNANPEIGDTITIIISFSQPVGTASLNLNYNRNILQCVGSNAWRATDVGASIKLDYIDSDFENKTITSMTVSFRAIAEGVANFTSSNIVISNANGDELKANISGSLTVNVRKQTEPEVPVNPTTPTNPTNPKPNTNSGTNTSTNTTKKPSTNSSTNKNTNTNTNTVIDTTTSNMPVTNTDASEENIIDNSIDNNSLLDNEHYNQIDNEADAIQNEEVENETSTKNKPNYMIFAIILIIAIAIIIIAIVIYRIRNYE